MENRDLVLIIRHSSDMRAVVASDGRVQVETSVVFETERCKANRRELVCTWGAEAETYLMNIKRVKTVSTVHGDINRERSSSTAPDASF